MADTQPIFEFKPKIIPTLAIVPWFVPVFFSIALMQSTELSSEARAWGFLLFVGGGFLFACFMSALFGIILYFANKKAAIRVYEDGVFQSTVPTQFKLPLSDIERVAYKPWGLKGRLLVYTKAGRKLLVVFSTWGFAEKANELKMVLEKNNVPVEGL